MRAAVVILAAGLAGGAGLGFIARDILDLGRPGVAVAWIVGALLGAERSLH